MNDFPSEYAKPMRPITGVIWLWITAFAVCGGGYFFAGFFLSGNSYTPRASCISQQKQIMLSVIMYSMDNADVAPPFFTFEGVEKETAFQVAVQPYLKNVEMFKCPIGASIIAQKKALIPSNEGIPGKLDYVHCLSLIGVIPEYSLGSRVLNLTFLKQPETTAYMRDVIRGYIVKDTPSFTSSHGNTFAVSYIDGHVRSVKLKSSTEL